MIIEFIGTPGSGKSTLMHVVIEYLHELGFGAFSVIEAARPFAERTTIGKVVSHLAPARFRQQLLWQVFYHLSTLYRFRFFSKHPTLIWRVLLSQWRRPIPAETRRYTLYWFFHLVGYYEFLTTHARPAEVLVFDEGFIHRVVQLNASDIEEPDPTRLLDYVDLLPRPDLVIAPLVPLELCEQRIYSRGLWERFRQKTPDEVSRFLSNSFRIVNLTLGHIREESWKVIEVDNSSDDLGVAKAELRRMLSGLPVVAYKKPQLHSTLEY
jgi:thymidylate kinase